MKKVLFVFGTRPEAIKLAPVILRMQKFAGDFAVSVCNTAQHRHMVQEPIDLFGLEVDIDLDIMEPDQDLFDITHKLIRSFKERVFATYMPDLVIVQGDTTTTMAGALSSFYAGIPFAHVEAGLRTGRMDSPFPEEFNRRVCSLIARRHYCPTSWAADNLRREGLPEDIIKVSGNTSIDSILWLLDNYDQESIRQHISKHQTALAGLTADKKDMPLVLITLHRREHFGPAFLEILDALKKLAARFPDIRWFYPVHPNPNVRKPAYEHLGSIPNFHLLAPLDYLSFVYLMKSCTLVLTDSGGVQEEAPSLGKPVLVIRETTERPEGVEAGTAKLVGVDPERIIETASRLLTDSSEYLRMAQISNPYGDGRAAERIVDDLKGF